MLPPNNEMDGCDSLQQEWWSGLRSSVELEKKRTKKKRNKIIIGESGVVLYPAANLL